MTGHVLYYYIVNGDKKAFPVMDNTISTYPYINGQHLIFQQDEHPQTLLVGSHSWYNWLETATKFTFIHDTVTFTARREQAGNKRGGWYWRVYYKKNGHLQRIYLGKASEITPERLNKIVTNIQKQDKTSDNKNSQNRPEDTSIQPGEKKYVSHYRIEPATQISVQHNASTNDHATRPQYQHLPTPLTSLIGRTTEIATARTLLLDPKIRELTLSGTGGVGKTRLALAIASTLENAFPDGICFVSLAAVKEPDLILSTITQAEGLQDNTTHPPIALLQTLLQEKHHLLLLDNFEQIIAAAPDLLDLLMACPYLKMLVTSREILHIRGEHVLEIQPLTLPDSKLQMDIQMIARSDAVKLFLERAQDIDCSVELTAHTAPMIMAICQHLDGLPLALELAAARLKVLTLPALLARLSHRLQILSGGPRDLSARQQTLRQTIKWSYDLLSPTEQRFFRLFSVFINGCTLEAAETVYSLCGEEQAIVLDKITSLLDKHLLYRNKLNDQTSRLLMHETLREYSYEALAHSGELERAQQAHAEYYLEQAETLMENQALVVLLETLQYEYANLHAALQWVSAQSGSKEAMHLEKTLLHFWTRHQHHGTNQSQHELAQTSYQSRSSSITKRNQHDTDHKISQQQQQASYLARSLYLLGMFAWIIGDFASAHVYTEKGLLKAQEADDTFTLAYLMDLSGQIALDQGEDTIAQSQLERGLALHRQMNDILGSTNTLFYLERIYMMQAKIQHAYECAQEHLKLARSIQFQTGIIGTLIFLGRLALLEGNEQKADKQFQQALILLRTITENIPLVVATNLQGIGVTLAMLGRLEDAVQLWGAADVLCPLIPEERASATRISRHVRAKLKPEIFTAAWSRGATMTQEEAIARIGISIPTAQPPSHPCVSAQTTHQYQQIDHNLTRREIEVLQLVAQGRTDNQIATILVISPRTVNAHLRSIYSKLNISSRNAATYFAIKHHLI